VGSSKNLVAGYRIAAYSCVTDLAKSFGSASKSKVLVTSATKVAFKFGEEPQCEGDAMAAG